MTRKELIESPEYVNAYVGFFFYEFKIAKSKKERKKVKKRFAKWAKEYAIEYSEVVK